MTPRPSRGEGQPPSPRSTQLLVELIMNPRDPGYEEAARRRGQSPARRWYDTPAVIAGSLLIGFLLVVAYLHAHRDAPQAAKLHDSLVLRVRDAQRQDATLATTLRGLNGRLSALRDQSLRNSGGVGAQLGRSQLVAGQVAVTGPGLVVTLSEPPAATPSSPAGRGGSTPITATNILTDRDVRSVVNELWADGAEAISVNGVRLTPTSAVRFAGQAVLVDFQPISSPYTITAIGNADDLATGFASSPAASRYQTLAGVEHIGFSFRENSKLSLPASAPVTPRYAHVPGRGHR